MCSSSTYPTEAGTAISTLYANDPGTTANAIINALEKDGALIVKGIASKSLCEQIRSDLKPLFDSDVKDDSGFFPPTTKRATGFFATSDACVELAINPLFQSVAERVLGSKYTYWEGQEQLTVFGKPYIASAVGFRVEPGGKQQALHRDDSDYHPRNCDMPVMLGCALTKTTKENGATIVIPKSHLWGPDRCPLDEEAIPGELEIGDAMLFLGNVYHAGGANTTKYVYCTFVSIMQANMERDDARETIGIFMCKGTLRQEENQFLSIPPEVAKGRNLPPKMLRLLGYGICPPALGFYKYRDPMKVIFGIEDEETVKK
ncbi:phytanoyl dioxygenase [Fusarium subglutinans]|uniref:Phytanoyl dioxygenase n=1 Tax=Gibberella subglutinans TaxID=42677 RepID=A0A8H5ULZ4_GIBSU|nr:phytanoyl dioxygenase [Fusarium subglutinans]KAF5591230.1 phytanoyl dioxygenase [Fusarium subglutinans]